MTFAALRDTRLESLSEAAQAWRDLARQLGDLERRVVVELEGPLRGAGWSGPASEAAFRRVDSVEDQFELSALQSKLVAAVLGRAAEELCDVQRRLHAALDAMPLLRLSVDDNGRVDAGVTQEWQLHTEEGRADRQRQYENVRIYGKLIDDLVVEATERDADFQKALSRLQSDSPGVNDVFEWKDAVLDAERIGGLLGVDEAAIPGRGASSSEAGEWWSGLTDDQRQLFLTGYPERLGALDGLPAAARDEANRLALRAHLASLAYASMNSKQGYREAERLTNLLDRLESSEYGPPEQRLLLLGLNNAGDGQAIVSVGDPDGARHTAVVVPGVGTELDGMRGQINRAAELQGAASRLAGPTGGPVSVVAWLGYDTPGLDGSAVSHRLSREGGVALDGFVNGLHTAHAGDASHVTAVGHSYGSTVVGEAARQGDGLAVTDIVVAGSPGMHVSSASELNMDTRHVWAGAASDDAISGTAGGIWGIHDEEPTDPDFGANRFHVDTPGHSGYWEPGSQSLNNQARIIVGLYADVSLDHGSAPR